MSGFRNALSPTDDELSNRLRLSPSTQADGLPDPNATAGYGTMADWFRNQRAQSAEMGLLDPSTGLPTRAGLTDAARQYASGLLVGSTAPGMRAFHGSPHSFDKFDLGKIGTGEGAQAYGHGLYFAENEGVARSYRDQLATPNLVVDGQNVGATWQKIQGGGGARTGKTSDALNEMAARGEITPQERDALSFAGGHSNVDDAINSMKYNAKLYGGDSAAKIWNQRANILESWRDRLSVEPTGHMYEVNINADPEHFLHWDKPLSEQSPHVRDALTQLGVKVGGSATEEKLRPFRQSLEASLKGTPLEPFASNVADDLVTGRNQWDMGKVRSHMSPAGLSQMDEALSGLNTMLGPQNPAQWSHMTGEHAYEVLHDMMPGGEGEAFQDALGKSGSRDVQISEALRNAGIPGIRYLDQGSRGAGEGSHNIVAFDPDTIEILRKYGLAGLGLGGAAAATAGAQDDTGASQ
jgi:hypothetical protein